MSTGTTSEYVARPWAAVQSRVSWGALIAGATVGIAIYSVLAMLGIAVGLTVADDASRDSLSAGAAIWAFVSLLIAMFFAGWVTTVCTVGETRTEAVLYGVIVWALTSSLLLWSTAAGLSLGYSAVLNRQNLNLESSEQAARALQDTTSSGQQNGGRDDNQNNAGVDRDTRERLQAASWWTFGGTVLSVLAAIGGALLGPYEIVARRDDRRGYARTTTVPG